MQLSSGHVTHVESWEKVDSMVIDIKGVWMEAKQLDLLNDFILITFYRTTFRASSLKSEGKLY